MKIHIEIHFRQLFDFDNPRAGRAFTSSLSVAIVMGVLTFSMLRGYGVLPALLGGLLASAATMFVVAIGVLWVAEQGARGVTSFVAPSGASTPSADDYSYEKALLARGEVHAALASLEGKMESRPDDAALCIFKADVHAREARDPAAAARLYHRAREMRGASSAHDYLATNRLIDLYLGALDDRVRAAAELERMRGRHAGTTAAAHAEQALRQIRSGTG